MKTTDTYCVIMAGGVSHHAWPTSQEERPKQFLDVYGTGRTLLQMTVDRFRSVVPKENILIVTNVLYREIVMEQVPDLDPQQILCEPTRRNTAPCIAYAVAHIKSIVFKKVYGRPLQEGEQVDWDDERLNVRMIVSPSNHRIMQEDIFLDVVHRGLDYVQSHDVLLTLGIRPTRPETRYGYIQMEQGDGVLRKVRTFTEKPDIDLAKVFYQSGEFLWNSGLFLWNLRTIRHEIATYLPDLAGKFLQGEWFMGTDKEEAFIQDMFPTCPSISIDYGVLEKSKVVYVICAAEAANDEMMN